MHAFYFTFGVAHPLSDYVQRVYASDSEAARRTMVEFYSTKWAFPYGENEVEYADDEHVVLRSGFGYRLVPKDLREGDMLL